MGFGFVDELAPSSWGFEDVIVSLKGPTGVQPGQVDTRAFARQVD